MKITRKTLISLYKKFDCTDWRNKIQAYLNSSALESDSFEMDVKQSDIDYLLKNGTSDQIECIRKLGLFPKNRMDELNGYLDACDILGAEVNNEASLDEQIKTIVKAANFIDNGNKLWKPDFTNSSQYKYAPYYTKNGSGWCLVDVGIWCYYACVSVGFYYKEKSTAELLTKRFDKLYKQWIES